MYAGDRCNDYADMHFKAVDFKYQENVVMHVEFVETAGETQSIQLPDNIVFDSIAMVGCSPFTHYYSYCIKYQEY